MPAPKKDTTKVEEVKVVESTQDNSSAQILEMLKQMQEQLNQSQEKQKELEEKLDKSEKEKEALKATQFYDTSTVSPDKVKLVHMLQGGTSLVTSIGKEIRFENLFEVRYVTKSDLEDLVFGHKFNSMFQNIGVYICDKSIREEMMLQQYYDKYDINENMFIEMLEMSYDDIKAKLSILPEDLQFSFKVYVIDEHKNGNKKAESRELLSALSDFFKTDIYAHLK